MEGRMASKILEESSPVHEKLFRRVNKADADEIDQEDHN